jgi:CheY-like chemotaxis protein
MNGFKTTEAIHASAHYRDRPMPIIALTSNTLMETKAQFLKSTGFTDYVPKPPRKDTFAALVKKYLPPPKLASLEWY